MKRQDLLGALCACVFFIPLPVNAAIIPLPELEGFYAPGGGIRTLPDGTVVNTETSRTVLFEIPVASTDTEYVFVEIYGRIVNWPYPVDSTAEMQLRQIYEDLPPGSYNPPISLTISNTDDLRRWAVGHNKSNDPWVGLSLTGPIPLFLNSIEDLVLEITSAVLNDPTIVPLPQALWLFGSGLLGIAGVARRKNAL